MQQLRDLALVADDLLILLVDGLDFGEVLRLAGCLAVDLDRLARAAGDQP